MLYPRLYLARNLLRDDGVIFISIDENEISNLRKACDEIFGEENFVGCAARISKKANNQGDYWSPNYDYILTFSKNKNDCPPFFGGVNYEAYDQIEDEGPRKGEKYQLVRLYMTSLDPLRGCTNQRYYIQAPDGTLLIPPGENFPSDLTDGGLLPPKTSNDKIWRWSYSSYLENREKVVVKKVRSSNLVDHKGNEVLWNVYTKTYLNDVISKTTAKPNSLIEDHINQNSSHELVELGIPFDFAKPSSLVKFLCEISFTGPEDLVLDFFSGSSSTAHAVLSLNQERKTRTRFICIQLPEKTYELVDGIETPKRGTEEAFALGYKTISDIGKERIRRVIKKITDEQSGSLDLADTSKQDLGFKVLKLDKSNFRQWQQLDPSAPTEKVEEELFKHIGHISDKATPEDLLYEILLKAGFTPTEKIETKTITSKNVFSIAGGALLLCLEDEVTKELINAVAALEPMQFICLDSAFQGNDQLKANAVQTFAARNMQKEKHNQIIFKTV